MFPSVGILYSSQDFLKLVRENPNLNQEFPHTLKTITVASSEAVLDVSMTSAWIQLNQLNSLELTPKGQKILDTASRESALRIQLRDLIESMNPPWVPMIKRGRQEASNFLPNEVKQCFREAELLESVSEEITSTLTQEKDTEFDRKLLLAIGHHFNEEELKTLCFHIPVEYDDLPASGRENKARELIGYCKRRNLIENLIYQIQYFRPSIKFDFSVSLTISTQSLEIIQWWDSITQPSLYHQLESNLSIARCGEKLSLEHEWIRTKKRPIWQSIESNISGYDLLSSVSENSSDNLKIGVRTSDSKPENALLHLSKNEWRVAMLAKNYIFHLWSLQPNPVLFLVNVEKMSSHIPADQGSGEWEGVTIPFKAII